MSDMTERRLSDAAERIAREARISARRCRRERAVLWVCSALFALVSAWVWLWPGMRSLLTPFDAYLAPLMSITFLAFGYQQGRLAWSWDRSLAIATEALRVARPVSGGVEG